MHSRVPPSRQTSGCELPLFSLRLKLAMLDPNTRRVLVCLRYGIGDLVMELPALDALRRTLPHARITALGAEPAIELLEGGDLVDEVVTLRSWGFHHRWDEGPYDAETHIHRWLNEREIELFVDLHHVPPRIGRIVWSRGIQSVESYDEAEAEALRRGETGIGAIREGVRVGWGVEVDPTSVPRIEPGSEHARFADELLKGLAGGSRSPVAISPVASSGLKRWPIEQLARLADELAEREERILIIGGPQLAAAEELRRRARFGDRMHVIGTLHLLRTAALLSRCRLAISNDTGLMHLAAAMRTPTVGIFGPTAPNVYRPPGEHVRSVAPRCDCPYRKTASLHPPACFTAGTCLWETGPCIARTPYEDVRAAVLSLLAEGDKREKLRVA